MPTEKFTARYQVADGYAGGARPQQFTIHADELEEDMDDAALARFYDESVYLDFQERVHPEYERLDEFIAWAKQQIENRKDDK